MTSEPQLADRRPTPPIPADVEKGGGTIRVDHFVDAKGNWTCDFFIGGKRVDGAHVMAALTAYNATLTPQPSDASVEAVRALTDMVALVEDMSRFVGQMSLKDYALFNEAPIKARAAITALNRLASQMKPAPIEWNTAIEAAANACELGDSYGPASDWSEDQANWWDTGVVDGSAMCSERIRALRRPASQMKPAEES